MQRILNHARPIRRIGLILFIVAALLTLTAAITPTLAATNGTITGVCNVGQTVYISLQATGTTVNTPGGEQIGAIVNSYAAWGTIPVDGTTHALTLTVVISAQELTAPVTVSAGGGDGAGHPIGSGFTGAGSYPLTPCTNLYGVPGGFVLRAITCTTSVNNLPGGQQVGQNWVILGQHWFVNPLSVLGPDGHYWTEVYVSGPHTAYILSRCVSRY
jgi:hypothetical protein